MKKRNEYEKLKWIRKMKLIRKIEMTKKIEINENWNEWQMKWMTK